MRSVLISFAAFLALVGCSKTTPSTKAPPPPSAYLYNREYLNDKDRENAESFKNFEDFATFVSRSSTLTIYEGLPHDVWESDLRDREEKTKKTITIEGHVFYATPVSAAAATVERIKTLSASKSSFVPSRGYKLCGGFHPDWCLVWNDGTATCSVFLCFGCEEMIVRQGGKRLIYCDLWDKSEFESLPNPLHVNRPKEGKS